jgi:hypothetical protein
MRSGKKDNKIIIKNDIASTRERTRTVTALCKWLKLAKIFKMNFGENTHCYLDFSEEMYLRMY